MFFTENVHFAGSNLLAGKAKYEDEIKVPISKWLYDYIEVGEYESYQ